MRRTSVTVVIVIAWVLGGATPASAHSVSGVSATNYKTRLKGVSPRVPGVEMRVIETDSRFELVNIGNEDVVVVGYQDEPYLRIGPDGVFQNRRSPATYLNASRKGTTVVPGTADPKADPDWEKTSAGHVARWHDHRIHWMGNQDPPSVRRAPGQRHVVIPDWTIAMRVGDRPLEARGDLVWVPGPSPVPWLVVAAVLVAAVTVLALSSVWARALAAVVALLVVVDFGHAVGIGFVKAGSIGTKVLQVAAGSFYSLIAWGAGVVAVWLLARRQPEGLFAAGFTGVVIALFGGLVDITDLSRSQVPFLWNASVARWMVAMSLGLGLGLLGAAVVGLRRHPVPLELAPVDGSGP